MDGKLIVETEVILKWLELADMSQKQMALKIGLDPSNFSKMLNNEVEPSKTFMKKVLSLTGLPNGSVFSFTKNIPQKVVEKVN